MPILDVRKLPIIQGIRANNHRRNLSFTQVSKGVSDIEENKIHFEGNVEEPETMETEQPEPQHSNLYHLLHQHDSDDERERREAQDRIRARSEAELARLRAKQEEVTQARKSRKRSRKSVEEDENQNNKENEQA